MLETAVSESTQFCRNCGARLGAFIIVRGKNEKKYKTAFFSIKPFDANGKKYLRTLCVDCFVKKNGRMPKSPNMTTLDYCDMLEIPEEEVTSLMTSRYQVTEEKYIKRFGEEEGTKKYTEYKKFLGDKNRFEYKQKRYGMTEEEFDSFNASRSQTEENFIRRHGEEEGLKKWESYKKLQAYAGTTKEYFIDKYGEEEGLKKYKEVGRKKSHTLSAYQERYGEEEGLKRYTAFCGKKHGPLQAWGTSILAINFINDLKPLVANCALRVFPDEFFVHDKEHDRVYFYDIVDKETKRCIEINGDYWHANPIKYKEDEILCFPLDTKFLASDIWRRDFEKLSVIRKEGFDVFVIWESEILSNREEALLKCKNFLLQ